MAICGQPTSTACMLAWMFERLPSVEPPAILLLFAKRCTGTPASAQTPVKIARLKAICLVGGLLDYNAAIEKASVAFVGFFGVVGMHRMGVVATHHHARRKSAAQVLPTEAEGLVYALKDVTQHG